MKSEKSMTIATRTDLFGCPATLSPDGDLDAWNNVQLGFLAHAATTADHLNKCLSSDPDFALPIICKGLFSLLLGRRELYSVAQQAESDARAAISRRPVTLREQTFLQALSDYNSGALSHAAQRLDQLIDEIPHDALAMKMVQAIRFVLGDANGMRSSIEKVIPHISETNPAYGYALGCHSFALEETGEYALAEKIGRKGMSFAADDAWGLHAVAHVYDMTNNTDAGLDWLQNRTDAWAHCNNFKYHVWWHMALMHLDRGDVAAVFELYDQDIRADKTDDYRDISNAASLLSRLELEGISVGDRWEELAGLSENRTGDGCLAFADLHYLLALIGGERKQAISDLLGRMRKDVTEEANEMERILKHPGLSAAEGLEAFGEGDFVGAFRHLAGARDTMQTIGGSHAQRDVFEQLTIEAALRGGYFDAAERFLTQRTNRRGGKEDRFSSLRLQKLAKQKYATTYAHVVPAE